MNAAAAKDAEKPVDTNRGLPRWLKIILIVIGLGCVAFLLWLLSETSERANSQDAERVRELNIAAAYLRSWPDVAKSIGKSSLLAIEAPPGGRDSERCGRRVRACRDAQRGSAKRGLPASQHLFHPDFGEIEVAYKDGPPCPSNIEISENQMTVTGEALAAGTATRGSPASYVDRVRSHAWMSVKRGHPVCFTIANLDLRRVAPPLRSFSHILLVHSEKPADTAARSAQSAADKAAGLVPNGSVVASIGSSELPIRQLSDLPILQSETSRTLVRTAEQTMVASGVKPVAIVDDKPHDALEPFDARVAGADYRFYWRPLALDTPGARAASEKGQDYFLVGVAAANAAPHQGHSRVVLAASAFALAIVIALLPIIKLAMLGPVDGFRPIEVTAVVAGLMTATALATAAWVGVHDVLTARAEASARLGVAAGALVKLVQGDVQNALDSRQVGRMASGLVRPNDEITVGEVEHIPINFRGLEFPSPVIENVFPLDKNGQQPPGLAQSAARDFAGGNVDLHDRQYFRRAVMRDFPLRAGKLLWRLKSNAPKDSWWQCATGGLVLDQIRSRTDGVPKTIIAAPLVPSCEPLVHSGGTSAVAASDPRQRPAVLAASFVMRHMLSPPLEPGVGYAMVDLYDPAAGRPVLLHSAPGLANVALFDESLDQGTRTTLAQVLKTTGSASSCWESPQVFTERFEGHYEEEPAQFAVARIPCTDWAIVTFRSRRAVDGLALQPAVHAAILWFAFAAMVYLGWALAGWWWRDRAWCFLWPDPEPRKKAAYLILALALGTAAIAGMLLVVIWPPLAALAALAAVGVAACGIAYLYRVHRIIARGTRTPARLVATVERRFVGFAVALLALLAVVPVAGVATDAHGYFLERAADANRIAERDAEQRGREQANQIVRTQNSSARESIPRQSPPPKLPRCGSREEVPPCPTFFTGVVRRLTGHDREPLLIPASDKAKPAIDAGGWWEMVVAKLVLLALALLLVLFAAIQASFRGLFGFGVAIEAVSYPSLPVPTVGDDTALRFESGALPRRFLVIGASDQQLAALRADKSELDLFNADAKPFRPPERRTDGEAPIVLVTNLGLLLGDPDRRLQALAKLEKLAAGQGDAQQPLYRIAILTTLAPLDRLLQSIEREKDESDLITAEQELTARRERAKHREDMRWSALLEEFTTFYQPILKRTRPTGEELETAGLPVAVFDSPRVETMWWELEYVPDRAVAAIVGDPEKPLVATEIVKWAQALPTDTEPRAIIDYLAWNLIEHYHLLWTLSGRAERLLLYHFAVGQIPNLGQAYALRSLVRRGLVVFDVYPRIMNRSFAQFVRHVEKPKTIDRWRRTQEGGVWQVARFAIALALPVALGVLLVSAMRDGGSLISLLPLLVAAGPALINILGSSRRTSAA